MEIAMRKHQRSESGQIIFLFAASFVTIMLIVMLVVDFGGAALTYHRAQVAADGAAYAAAQAIDLEQFYSANRVLLDPAQAAFLAESYATANSNGRLYITGFAVQDERVWLSGEMEYRTLFAHAIGLPVIRTRVSASAVPAYGIEQRGQ
jgi:Flp pilus assembly protein TadG